jgi:hypothetical protein
MLLRNLFENLSRTGKGKSAVIGWGRGMGHKGHMFLASSVITQAKETNSDPYFVVSRTVGKDDPINPEEKLAIYKKVFPQSGHIFQTATEEMPDLTRVLTKLNQMGYTDATVVVGADQVNALGYVKNYNGKPNKAGNIPFTFDTLNVISRQETNDPSRDQEGPRATPMRAVLMDPAKSEEEKFAVWRDAMNPELSDEEVMDLMHKAEQRMRAMIKPKKGVAEGNYQHNYGHEFKDFKAELEKKHGQGNVKIVGDGNVADAYHVETGKHLGFIDGSHAEVNEQGVAEAVDIGQEWMSDTELDQYVPQQLQQQWRDLLGYDRNGNPSALWSNLTGGYEPDVNDPQHRALMVKVANKWFASKKIPNVKFFNVKDADDELEWLVQIGEQGLAEGYSLGKVLPFPELLDQILHILTTKHRGIGWKTKKHSDNTFVFSALNDYRVWSMLVVEGNGDDWVTVGHGIVTPEGNAEIFDRQQLPMTLASASEIADEAIQTYHDIDLSDYADPTELADLDEQGVAEGEYNPDTFVGKKGTYKGYGITQEGPHQWGISSSVRKFSTLAAAKRHIDKVLVVSEQGVAEAIVSSGDATLELLELNIFKDLIGEHSLSNYDEEFAQSPEWQKVVARWAPMAEKLYNAVIRLHNAGKKISSQEAKSITDTAYDGSDAYNDPESAAIDLPRIYKQQYKAILQFVQNISKPDMNMHEQDAAEGEANYDSEWDEKVKRLGQMAKEGPRKTVWDPVKRVYKTVPVNAPTKDKPTKETKDGGSYAVNKPGYSGEANYTAQPNWRGHNIGEDVETAMADAIARLIESQLK